MADYPIHEDAVAALQAKGMKVEALGSPARGSEAGAWLHASNAAAETLSVKIREADVFVSRLTRVTGDLIEAGRAGRLKVIARHGAGVDTVDVAAATRHGVVVIYAPEANAVSVAEHAIAFMLALAKGLTLADRALRVDGDFGLRFRMAPEELCGKTVGVVGLGAIGRLVARKCAAGFDMKVLGYDPYAGDSVRSEVACYGGKVVDDMDHLLEASDFVTLHVPLNDSTRGLIGARELGLMKSSAYLINCARGGVVDEGALYDALKSGRIRGAALDVFGQEPPPVKYPLFNLPNVIATPHVAGITAEAMRRISINVAEDIIRIGEGRKPIHTANPEAWPALLGRMLAL